MTHHYEVRVTRHAQATPSTLFDVVADGSRWSEWARPLINYSAWETRGPADDGGVGAVRAVGTPRFPAREQTTIHEPGQRHGYTIISKTPVRNYQAQVTFTPSRTAPASTGTGRSKALGASSVWVTAPSCSTS
ncbi:SRPBCC family protein [Mycolicibacterium mucogenicum]|uniref:MxaD family protein n=1 Tax=Mycolicibacterium mucogenicum DSM 44124 TaxID=1226753 RepID=A0A8H2J9D0_MYCMU|nr:SRPBCC family protein [Mycolicibacterium mucogenicum]QPG69818.1 SRPBCC family protein [Mycolicibacterium mucogenicum DSM 44124]